MKRVMLQIKATVSEGVMSLFCRHFIIARALDWYQSLKYSIFTGNKNLENQTANKILM